MKELIQKRERNANISKEEFVSDVEILFAELKNSYGGYDYFGEEAFLNAKQIILQSINEEYDFECAVNIMEKEFSKFIYDGHFSIDGRCVTPFRRTPIYQIPDIDYDYAIKTYEVEGIPVFDIKKFYYDNEEERLQLDDFARSGEKYKDVPCLIFDLRQNIGGSDTYLCDFMEGLNGEVPDYPMDFRQNNSDTFLEWLKENNEDIEMEPGIMEDKSEGKTLQKEQDIYVLVDRCVASSGESAVANLKTMSGAVIVGENTRGCFFCGNCIDIYLPNSGLKVYYGTGRLLYNGTQNIDELGGFEADICGAYEVEDVVKMYLAKREKKVRKDV